jgi:hypothetical protein
MDPPAKPPLRSLSLSQQNRFQKTSREPEKLLAADLQAKIRRCIHAKTWGERAAGKK